MMEKNGNGAAVGTIVFVAKAPQRDPAYSGFGRLMSVDLQAKTASVEFDAGTYDVGLDEVKTAPPESGL